MRNAMFYTFGAIEIEAAEFTEWLRGNEDALLERFLPLVSGQSLVLDFGPVRRIDTAGLAVLVALYRTASESGHSFAIANPASPIVEILAAVGLDRVLLRDGSEATRALEPCLACNAA